MADYTDFLAPLIGGALGSQSGSQQAGTTTTTSAPWSAIQPYIVGGVGNTPGIVNQAGALYGQQQNGMPDYLKNQYTNFLNTTNYAATSPITEQLNKNIQGVLAGKNAPTLQSINPITAQQGQAAQAQLNFAGLPADPTSAYQRMLTGQVDTSTLDPVVQNAARRMSDQFNEQVMPGINQGATASGQYGSSRQGIAQGLAMKGLSQSIGDMTGNMYNNAYNNAQNLMGNAAGQLGGYATSMANNNAALATQVNMANAAAANQAAIANQNAQATANSQAMQNYNNQVGAMNTAGNLYNSTLGNVANLGMSGINAANNANNYNWQQLGNYQSAVQPFASMGSTQSTPYYNNPMAGALGGAYLGTQIAKNLGV